MDKRIELIENTSLGIDLMIEKDSGNSVRILTGKPERSYEFWQRLRAICDIAIDELDNLKDDLEHERIDNM